MVGVGHVVCVCFWCNFFWGLLFLHRVCTTKSLLELVQMPDQVSCKIRFAFANGQSCKKGNIGLIVDRGHFLCPLTVSDPSF